MRPTDEKKIRSILAEITIIAKDLPSGKSRKISNRCDKVAMIIKKSNRQYYGKIQCKESNPQCTPARKTSVSNGLCRIHGGRHEDSHLSS